MWWERENDGGREFQAWITANGEYRLVAFADCGLRVVSNWY